MTPGSTDLPAKSVVNNHFVQLDGLRALAALSVIIQHCTPLENYIHFPLGLFGLWLFFVLSGFLITGILLRSRADAAGDRGELMYSWRAFYARRMLRIFPLYYTALIVAAAIDLPGARQSFGWNAAHIANVAEVSRSLQAPAFAHFWSLSVEEQFYFIWPTIVLLAPRRWIIAVSLGMVAVAPLARLVMMTHLPNFHYARVLPPACTDGLGMGALLAIMRETGTMTTKTRNMVCRAALALGLLILVGVMAARLVDVGYRIPFSIRYSAYALVSLWLINGAADGFRGPARRFLEFGPLVYLGKISFGIYVLHLMIPSLMEWLRSKTGLGFGFPEDLGLAQFLYVTALSVVLASMSWYGLEKPINDLKRFFPYRAAGARGGVGRADDREARPAAYGARS